MTNNKNKKHFHYILTLEMHCMYVKFNKTIYAIINYNYFLKSLFIQLLNIITSIYIEKITLLKPSAG